MSHAHSSMGWVVNSQHGLSITLCFASLFASKTVLRGLTSAAARAHDPRTSPGMTKLRRRRHGRSVWTRHGRNPFLPPTPASPAPPPLRPTLAAHVHCRYLAPQVRSSARASSRQQAPCAPGYGSALMTLRVSCASEFQATSSLWPLSAAKQSLSARATYCT